MVNFLENGNAKHPKDNFEICLAEAIKCHHNNIARYIIDNLLSQNTYLQNDEVLESIFRYYNYSFFPEKLDQDSIFFYLCQFNYSDIVGFIMQMKNEEFYERVIFKQKKIFFNKISLIKSF